MLKLKDGDVVIEMYPNDAPNHVARIKELVRAGFYNGLKFHRVIDGFMAQTGCPYGNGTGGTGHKLKAEFNRNPHKRGTVSMARAMNPDSGDSQFFICFADCPWLDGQYTVWGEVTSGMEFVEVLDVHHIQEVYLGGSDDINNLITACTVCHKLIHLHGRGELYMRPLDELSESEQRRFKRIIKLGNKIRMDMKMKGMKVDQLKKMDNTETIGRTKPGTGQTAG